ncbi:hypothetical protein D3C81_2235820 [compost metagenome]
MLSIRPKVLLGPIVSQASKCAEKQVQHKTHTEKTMPFSLLLRLEKTLKLPLLSLLKMLVTVEPGQDLSQV